MEKLLDRIYVEITDYCNLNCEFCTTTRRNTTLMDSSKFGQIVDKISPFTNNIYLHVLGEGLLHPKIDEIITTASEKLNVNITTNGALIKKNASKLLNLKIKKINFSLNSSYNLNYEEVKEYLFDILTFINQKQEIDDDITFNLRLWAYDKYLNKSIIGLLEEYFLIAITLGENIKLKKKVILTFDKMFNWPDINNDLDITNKRCLGGKNHLAIMSNGDIAICCLDYMANSNLGNIFNSTLDEILRTSKYLKTIKNFNDNKTFLNICKHCDYNYKKD